jgi:hypothetical protein
MKPHDCPGCGAYYRPRGDADSERCWSCAGLGVDYLRRARRQPVVAAADDSEPALPTRGNHSAGELTESQLSTLLDLSSGL